MKTQSTATIKLMFVFAFCLTAAFVAFPQRKELKDSISIETLAARALETYLKTSYKGNGQSISASGVNSFLTKNKISLSNLPDDIASDIRKGNVEALLIPDVSNPRTPGTTGDVVVVRSKCLLSTLGCSHRGFLIQPPNFLDCDDCYEHCSGCEGAKNPPACDLYDTCVCTQGRSPAVHCKKCPGC